MTFKLGAHVSIQGGFRNVPQRIKDLNGNCGQIFVSPPQGWVVPKPKEEECVAFKAEVKKIDCLPIVVHSKYLLNLGSPKDSLFNISVHGMKEELRSMEMLGLKHLIFHPGAHVGSGEEAGLKRIVKGINKTNDLLNKNLKLVLENTAGKGTTLGTTWDELSYIKDHAETDHVGFCLDTQHLFASGVDLRDAGKLDNALDSFDSQCGLKHLDALHLNDSMVELGSRKDRHQNIGKGEIGLQGIKNVVTHKKLQNKPFILETPISSSFGHKQDVEIVKKML